MSYFSLRKERPEPEPETVEEEPLEAPEGEPEPEPEEQPAVARGPILTGLLGPGNWVAARFGTGAAWAVHAIAVWAISFYGGWIAAGVILAWLLAVLLFVPREHLDRATAAIERRTPGSSPQTPTAAPPPGGEREVVRQLLLDLIGETHGVHLRTVLAHLQKHSQWEGRTVADLRVHLEALGIPVQPKVKVAGTPTRGVLKADLEALSPHAETVASHAPSPPV